MKTLFLCGIYPDSLKKELFKNSIKGYQFAAQNLQEAIVDGFIQNKEDLSIITIPFLSTFPFGYKKPVVKYKPSKFSGIVPTICASFINIPFLEVIGRNAEKSVLKWCHSENDEINHIIIYSLNLNLIEIAIKAKSIFNNVKLTVIVPDLPEFMGMNNIYRAIGLKRRHIKYFYNNIHLFNKFVLLSEAMSSVLNIESKQYIVVEGIFNSLSNTNIKIEAEKEIKTILYTGAVSYRYGIETLLRAFISIRNKEYRLVICGDGDAKKIIQHFSDKDKRINYMGEVTNELILTLQKTASLLINPRTPEGEYTKFSFPSKTMEYFASGVPVLMYRLPGVPPEYFKYCYTLVELTQKALAAKMVEILSLPIEERKRKGKEASEFIFQQKSAKNQVRRIIELMNEN